MRHYLFIFFVFVVNVSFAQEIQTVLKSKIELNADRFIGVDDLENTFYLIQNVLFKKSKTELLSYNNVNLGKISSVNIQNPFKIILFYKDYNSVILLDNKLNELTGKIDFTKETLFNNVQFVSLSSENDLWLLADDNKIHLYDYQNKLQKLETQPLRFYQKQFIPIMIKSTYKYIWVFSNKATIQFNEYGSYISFTELDYQDFVHPFQGGYLYQNRNALFYQSNNKIVSVKIDLKYPFKEIYVNKESIYTFDGKFLYQYNIL